MILPAGCVARPSRARNAHAALLHYSLAQLIGFDLLVVPDQLNTLFVALGLAKHIFVLPQQVPKCLSKIFLSAFPYGVDLLCGLPTGKSAILSPVPGESPFAAHE